MRENAKYWVEYRIHDDGKEYWKRVDDKNFTTKQGAYDHRKKLENNQRMFPLEQRRKYNINSN